MSHHVNTQYDTPRKNRFIGAATATGNVAAAAREHDITPTAARQIFHKWETTGSTHNKPRCGRPSKVNETTKRLIVRTTRKSRRLPFTEIGNTLPEPVSTSTVRRVVASEGRHRRVARRVPRLTKKHMKARLAWAKERLGWGEEEWAKVIWSDEVYVCLGERKGRVWVTRAPGEEYDNDCVVSTWTQSPIRIMVWACIMRGEKGPMVVLDYPGGKGGGMTAARYQEQVLEACLLPTVERRPHMLFQQDNAAPHKAKSSMQWLDDHHVNLLHHPAQSPDVNPIEPVWGVLKHALHSLPTQPTTRKGLEEAFLKAWRELPQETVDRFVLRMPEVVRSVVDVKGGHTKY